MFHLKAGLCQPYENAKTIYFFFDSPVPSKVSLVKTLDRSTAQVSMQKNKISVAFTALQNVVIYILQMLTF